MRGSLILATAILATASHAGAQTPRVYDRLDASFEAEQFFDGRRQFLVDRQRWLHDEMVFWSSSFPGWAYFAAPWPFLPGDIYGYPLPVAPIRRPVGRMEEQVGPNTWHSRPIQAHEGMPIPMGPGAARPGPRGF